MLSLHNRKFIATNPDHGKNGGPSCAKLSVDKFRIWIIVCIVLGIFLRLYRYLSNSSLCVDEAKLALNIVHSSFSDLFGPLLNPPQIAPVGFVLSTKLLTDVFFENELTLRLIPLVSGILSIFLFFSICKKLFDQKPLFFAVTLFSISECLIQYSAEFKQYSSDVFFSLLLIHMVLKTGEEERESIHILSLSLLIFIGFISLFFSHPSAFILCIIVFYLIFSLYKSFDTKSMVLVITAAITWSIGFFLNYLFFVLNSPAINKGLYDFWQTGFLTFPPLSAAALRQYFQMVNEIFGDNPLKLFYPGLFFFGFIAGCMTKSIRQDRRFFLILAPIIVTMILSILGFYPMQGRLILFLSPFLIIFISLGFSHLYDTIAKDSKIIACLLMVIIFSQPVLYQVHRLVTPNMGEEIKEALTYYQANRTNHESLYVYYGAKDAFKFYKKRFGIDNSEYIIGNAGREDWQIYNEDINNLKGKGKVWFLFSHVTIWFGVDEEKYFIHFLNRIGKQIKSYKAHGASVYLYDLQIAPLHLPQKLPGSVQSG